MAMKTLSAPRRVYLRSGLPLICYGGLYFGAKPNTKITEDRTVRIAVLPRSHGKARIAVTQGLGENAVTENWTEAHVVFQTRG